MRIAGAHLALREVADLLGHSPSVAEYRSLGQEHPERSWPADGTIRRILGESWNEALKSSSLNTVAGGDMLVASLGSAFTKAELIAAVRECRDELGGVPSLHEYVGWVKKAEVRRREGRRPTSQGPFTRALGSWLKTLVAADLVDGSKPELIGWNSSKRPRITRITDEGVQAILSEISGRLGHSPSFAEYQAEREALLEAAQAAGTPRAIPSGSALQRRYGSWRGALKLADLEPSTSQRHGKGGPKGPRVADAECLAVLREAFEACGSPLTIKVYQRWRSEQLAGRRAPGSLPGYERFKQGWGSWEQAIQAAFGGDERSAPPESKVPFRRKAKSRGRYPINPAKPDRPDV